MVESGEENVEDDVCDGCLELRCISALTACYTSCTSLRPSCSETTETLNDTLAAFGQGKQMNELKQMVFTSKFKAGDGEKNARVWKLVPAISHLEGIDLGILCPRKIHQSREGRKISSEGV